MINIDQNYLVNITYRYQDRIPNVVKSLESSTLCKGLNDPLFLMILQDVHSVYKSLFTFVCQPLLVWTFACLCVCACLCVSGVVGMCKCALVLRDQQSKTVLTRQKQSIGALTRRHWIKQYTVCDTYLYALHAVFCVITQCTLYNGPSK